jgi:hypothetical protein
MCALCERPLGDRSLGCPANHKLNFAMDLVFGTTVRVSAAETPVIRVTLLPGYRSMIHVDNEPTPEGARWAKGGSDDPT